MSSHFFKTQLYRYTLQVILAFVASSTLWSQIITDPQKEREQIFIARIKQFNEFVDRFNLKTDFNGNPADSAFLAKMPRERMISMLFDLKDPRILKSGKEYSGDYIKTKEAFISDVTEKKLMLYKFSPGIIAEAKARVLLNGIPQQLRLFLIQEAVGNDMVKWVLYSVRGDILNIFKTDTSMVRFISPSSNETDFINLKRALEDTDYLAAYAHQDFKPDNLTLFFSLIRGGELKYEYVEEVIYHVIDIPGWYLRIRDFNRIELNSGWLITDVARNNLDIGDFIENLQ